MRRLILCASIGFLSPACVLWKSPSVSPRIGTVDDLLPIAPSSSARVTASGLAYEVLQSGHGTQHPGPESSVTVHYTGWRTDGVVFDSSVSRGQPATFPLNRVISGWTEGVQLMVVGEKTRFFIPENLAYKGRAGAPAGMLIFDVELLAIE